LNRASLFCKLGGYLVYATCSTIYDENEGVVQEFLSNNSHFSRSSNNLALKKENIFLDKTWNVFDSCGNIQLWTDSTDTDSFFMTRLIRTK
jgi:16S rRNA (cytosine967-C5)-methyltransferase